MQFKIYNKQIKYQYKSYDRFWIGLIIEIFHRFLTGGNIIVHFAEPQGCHIFARLHT